MKKRYPLLLLLLSLLGPVHLRAQTTDSLRLKLDAVFAHLDKSQVPTRLLDAYAHPLAPLAPFQGQLADSTRTNASLFRALFATAYTACIYGPNPLPSLTAYNARVQAAETAAGAAIPVMAQLINYATVRPDAFRQNLLSLQNRQVYDVPGRPASPYATRFLFAVAPARQDVPTGDVALVFPQNLYVQLGAPTLQAIEADFGDGRGYLAATWGQPLRATYTSSGPKRVKVRFSYPSQAPAGAPVSYESQFDLFVAAPAAAAAPAARTAAADPSVYFAAQPGQAAGTMYIHYASKHAASATLTKPFIVAEGYDRSAIAPHTAKNYSIEEFLVDIKTTPGFNLKTELENTGDYDIVFIDYENGTDDILLNAGLFKRVLDYVNTHKDPAAHEQNVVMGMSMGGLIARYKLAQMEKAAPGSTDTRLLLLQDSPQRGANFPLGLSALIRQAQLNFGPYLTGDIDVIAQEVNALLDQPATQQLLLYQTMLRNPTPRSGGSVFNSVVDYRANTFIEGDYRTMITYPAPYKIVAVSQGSQCGVGLFAPYTEMVKAAGYFNLFNLPFVFAGSSGISGEVIVNAIPANGQANRVSGLHLIEQTQLFFGLITLKVDLVRDNFSCPTGLLPLDGAAGGTEPIGNAIGGPGRFLAGTAYGHSFIGGYALVPAFSFISTPSGLDVADYSLPALSAKYINSVASFSASRTNGFLAQEQTNLLGGNDFNVPHLTFTARNGEFIFDQMEGKSFASNFCSAECSAVTATISGPAQLCPGAAGTYTISNLPAGVQVRWRVSTSGVVTPGSGTGTSFTVQGLAGADGNTTIQATLVSAVGGCELPLAELPVRVGGSQVGIAITGDCAGQVATFSAGGVNIGTNYRWAINGQAQPQFDNLAQVDYTLPTNPSIDYITVAVAVAGTCPGSGTVASTTQVHVTHDAGCANNLTAPQPAAASASIYPNPVHESLYVRLENVDTARPTTVRLFDSRGRLALEQSSKGELTIKVKVNKLPPGLYFVHVLRGSEVLTRQQLRLE